MTAHAPRLHPQTRSSNRRRAMKHRTRLLYMAGTVAASAAIVASGGGASAATHAATAGQPPPEWAENAGSWPAHNYDLSKTRATTNTPINSQTVAKLKEKWHFDFKAASAFGAFASAPISVNGSVHLEDLNSNIYALDRSSRKI